jgi:hypothetical protein
MKRFTTITKNIQQIHRNVIGLHNMQIALFLFFLLFRGARSLQPCRVSIVQRVRRSGYVGLNMVVERNAEKDENYLQWLFRVFIEALPAALVSHTRHHQPAIMCLTLVHLPNVDANRDSALSMRWIPRRLLKILRSSQRYED